MENNQTYTFEDWLNDPKDYYKVDLIPPGSQDPVDKIEVPKTGNYPKILYNQNKINEDTFKKIQEEQERAFDIAADYHIKNNIADLENRLSDSAFPFEVLRYREKALLKLFKESNPEVMELVSSGRKDLSPITASVYKIILDNEEKPPIPKELPDLYRGHDPFDEKLKESTSFNLYIKYQEYLKIKKLRNKLDHKTDPKLDLLKEFVQKFSETTEYSQEILFTYLNCWIEHRGLSYPRAKAKKHLESNNFTIPADGTLSNWEQKWEEFHKARTAK